MNEVIKQYAIGAGLVAAAVFARKTLVAVGLGDLGDAGPVPEAGYYGCIDSGNQVICYKGSVGRNFIGGRMIARRLLKEGKSDAEFVEIVQGTPKGMFIVGECSGMKGEVAKCKKRKKSKLPYTSVNWQSYDLTDRF